MKILAVSDQVDQRVYNPGFREHAGDVEMVLGCGDLPYSYMENIATLFPGPCLYVHGNHDHDEYLSNNRVLKKPGGWVNLDARTVKAKSLIVGGIEGSRRYRPDAPYQYEEWEIHWKIWRMGLSLLWHRIVDGRYLDILITHSPPWGIHDGEDLPHRGFRALLHLMRWFRPAYLLHGHHHAPPSDTWCTRYLQTKVINVYPLRTVQVRDPDG